jgi:hypothetical protein
MIAVINVYLKDYYSSYADARQVALYDQDGYLRNKDKAQNHHNTITITTRVATP